MRNSMPPIMSPEWPKWAEEEKSRLQYEKNKLMEELGYCLTEE